MAANPTVDQWSARRGRPMFSTPPLSASKLVLCVGSSSEAGNGAGDGSSGRWMTDARTKMYFMKAATFLRDELAPGLPVQVEGDYGNHNNADTGRAGYTAYDPRITFPAGAVTASGQSGMGGNGYLFSPGTQHSMRVDFTGSFTAVSFVCSSTASGNNIQYSTDGGSTFTTYSFTSSTPVKLSVTGLAKGNQSLIFRNVAANANSCQLHGFSAYDATRSELRFSFAGARSWNTTTTYWTATGQSYSPMTILPIIAPDVVIDTFGGNEDFTTSGTLDAFITRCGTWYDAVIAAGGKPGMCIKPFRNAGGKGSNYYSEYEIRDARITLAKTKGIPYLDLSEAAGPLSLSTLNSEVQSDGLHMTADWHARVGKAVGYWLFSSGLLF